MPLRLAFCLIPLTGWVQAQVPPSPLPAQDPLLLSLLQEALANNPDLAQAKDLADADQERVPQAQALPDPSLSLGIQNDGFNRIQVGQMETSYYQVMVTQPLPWPGKRALRGEVAQLGARATAAALTRTRLTLEADLERSYLGLLLIRSQLRLLETQAVFLQQAEATAKSRYEVGQGSQADLLRAQLERTRLDQARSRLQADERTRLAELNRIRGQAPATPIATTRTLEQVPDPAPVPADFLAKAETGSPELQSARLGIQQAGRSLDLARLDRHPDFTVSAGYMPRGGLEPMWTASVGITLPVWQKHKQQRAVAEQEYRQHASGWEAERVRCLLAQRVQERSSAMDSALQVIRLYRGGLLIQSEGAFRATLSQYEVGRMPFVSVLEGLNGWVADQGGLLQAQAEAQSIQVALTELNLGPTPGIGSSGLAPAAMGGGGQGSAAAAMGPARAAQPAAGGESNASSAM
jgi:outer membrane protein TolC